MQKKSENEELSKEQVKMLKAAFEAFDIQRKGQIPTDTVGTILEMMGHKVDSATLLLIISEVDADQSGQIDFSEFCALTAQFLPEEEQEDPVKMRVELREAFKLFDTEANGYITTEVMRDILYELDEKMTEEDLDEMIDEIDVDGSGTVDFDEFMQVMTGD